MMSGFLAHEHGMPFRLITLSGPWKRLDIFLFQSLHILIKFILLF